jgi:FkbM family methyltransferase
MANDRATFSATLALLARKGLTYGTVFDLGCADGHFFVQHHALFAASIPVNIDANALYEPSLKAIQDVLGGYYRIAAVSDQPGEIELNVASHPYWSSLRGDGDAYWDRLNRMRSGVQRVPAIRLDDLAAELTLKPPYLLKLDVQGAEIQALRGAKGVLAETSVVVCEADMNDFQAINAELLDAGFRLYDITALSYGADQSLGWFYPVYLHGRHAGLIDANFWRAADNEAAIRMQVERRNSILARLNQELARIKSSRATRP